MAADPTTISFARGAPSLDIIDVEGLKQAAQRAFTDDPAGSFAYGTSVGYLPLRSWIAERHGVAENQVLVTNGSMQADAFLFSTLVSSGDAVIVERPSYDRTLGSLRSLGADLHAVDVEPDGVSVDGVRAVLDSGVTPALAHLIPSFHNPAGYSISAEKRTELVGLAREHGFTIFEDDPYVELRFSGERLPTMFEQSDGEVVYASSFSKTVCPGIRVGYLVGSTELIGRIAGLATSTYISPNMVAQSIVNSFVRGGSYETSIETVKTALAERSRVLCEGLRALLPEVSFVEPEGGYFLWLTFPEGTDGDALFDACTSLGLQVVKGSDFLLDGAKNHLRLAYSGVSVAQITEGVTRLAEAYRSL